MKFKLVTFLLMYGGLSHALSQQDIDNLALKGEALVLGNSVRPTDEIKLKGFLSDQMVDNKSLTKDEVTIIIKRIIEIKNDPKLKVILSNEEKQMKKADNVDTVTLSKEQINELAIQAEPKMKGVATEHVVRNYLKNELGLLNKKDINAVIDRIIELQKNPKWKVEQNPGNTTVQDNKKPDDERLSKEDINQWVAKVMKNRELLVGAESAVEFKIKKHLKDNGVVDRKDQNLIYTKVMELENKKGKGSEAKKGHSNSDSQDSKGSGKKIEVSPMVEEYAKKLMKYDPETQRITIVRELKKENVTDMFMITQILSKIKQLREQNPNAGIDENKQSENILAPERKDHKFYDLEERPAIQKITALFLDNEQAMMQFIQLVKFKLSNNLDILWQDLVVYFYFTTLERPEQPGKEQTTYDWVLKHDMDNVYKNN